MLAIAHACAVIGLDGEMIEVQVDFNPKAGIPSFSLVGLPDSAIRESRERVRAAIKNSGLRFPNKGYVVNLSPANLPKHGPAYDLSIAVGVLASTDQIPLEALEQAVFIGELSLDGRVRHVQGVMPMTYAAHQAGYESIFVPAEDANEASLIQGITVYPVETLGQLIEHLYELQPIAPAQFLPPPSNEHIASGLTDFADVRGQEHVKRALEIAAAGNHNVRMVGPPGVGKSLLAKAMPAILPRMTLAESLEVTRIYSVADMLQSDTPLIQHRPFRAPHHTISQAGLVGGGTIPRPGEISLGHLGVLFLDEANEFSTAVLEVMRQPIEDKTVTISRARGTLSFPANFLLVLAHNPCPCGYYGDTSRPCTCSVNQITRYQAKLSGPLLDRIDIHVEVPRVDYDKLMGDATAESSLTVRQRVESARQRQQERFIDRAGIYANADMNTGDIQTYCTLHEDARQLLDVSVRRMQMSARAYHRTLKLSRTIADLADKDLIGVTHIAEALQYRPRDGANQ